MSIKNFVKLDNGTLSQRYELYTKSEVDDLIEQSGLIPLEDNNSTTAGTWLAKTDKSITLTDGMLFLYKVAVAGADTTTLKITANNVALTTKNVYRSGTTKVSTNYAVGSWLILYYTSTSDCFRILNDVDKDTTSAYNVLEFYLRPYAGAEAIYRYKLVALDKDNRLVPITVTNQESETQVAKVPTQVAFKPNKIWQYYGTDTIAAGSVIGKNKLMSEYYNTYCSYNFNASVAAYRMIYLRGTYNKTTGLFTLYKDNSSPCTSYYTLVPNNTANLTLSSYFTSGYDYILVGCSYSSANYMQLFQINTLYHFDGTNLVEIGKDNSGGTVTSVGVSVPTGLSVSGSPITTSGTIAISLASGYSIPTTSDQTTWSNKQAALTTSSVSDGTINKAIGFDSNGNLVKGTVSGGGGTTVTFVDWS